MKYHRILTRLCNTPLFISGSKLDIISSNVTIKLLQEEYVDSIEPKIREAKIESKFSDVAIIEVFDSLVSKGGAGDSGFTSYQSIEKSIHSAILAKVKTIGFYIDSPGGEASGLFSLTSLINSLPSKYGISTFSFIDGNATSAAYAIASATEKLYATPVSLVGSIGAVMTMIDMTKRDEKEGLTYHIIRSKELKALGDPHEEMTSKVLAKARNIIMSVDDVFNKTILQYRTNLTLENIIDFKGQEFIATEGKELGLIDSIVDSIEGITELTTKDKNRKLTTTKGNVMTLEEALAENIKLSQEISQLKAEMSLAATKAKNEEQARVLAIVEAGKTLSIPVETAIKFAKTGMEVETAVTSLETIKEAMQMTTHVDTSTESTTPAIDKSKIVTQQVPKSVQLKEYLINTTKLASEQDVHGGLL